MIASTFLVLLGAGVALARPTKCRATLPSAAQPVIVQMFEWNWNSVGAECQSFLGPAGYKYVQVSTAVEHIQGDQWWTSYQTVSYNVQSKRGSRDEFKAMIDKCHAAGVSVLVDTVWNHMAGIDSGTGVAGTSFQHYNYPGTYSENDFHHCGTLGDDIRDGNNQTQIQTCELSNLADLKTESEYVRSRLAQHANDLLSLGADGFRIDAAKHVPLPDLQNIFSRLSRQPSFVTLEYLGGGHNYAVLGPVSISGSYDAVRDAFGGKNLTKLNGWESKNGFKSSEAAVYVATHDSERGHTGGSLSYKSPNNSYTLANIFMLAYPYGTPTVLSSYEFSSVDAGAPNGGNGACSGAGGANGFLCQHRWAGIANMVQFRNAVGTAALNHWQTGNSNQIAFGRGSAGFVAINYDGGVWSTGLATDLPAGTYCDAITGGKNGGSCAGTSVTVSGGKISVQVPAFGAIVVHSGTKL